jgi:hypothetical protein
MGYGIQKDTVDTRDKKSRGRRDKRQAQNLSDELRRWGDAPPR